MYDIKIKNKEGDQILIFSFNKKDGKYKLWGILFGEPTIDW
jgi:hypothetical protein